MTKVLYLVRHGQASFGQADYDQLSMVGIEQSHHVGSALTLKPETIDARFTGTLKRHRQTFEHACPDGPAPIVLHGWNEFDHEAIFKARMVRKNISRDTVQGYTDAERLAFFKQAVADWVHSPQDNIGDAESWTSFTARVRDTLTETIRRTDKAAMVFTSGGPIATVVGQQWGFSAEQILRLNQSLINTGITKLLVHARGTEVVTVNEHVHLEQAGKRLITYK